MNKAYRFIFLFCLAAIAMVGYAALGLEADGSETAGAQAELTNISPADGTSVAGFAEGETLSFTTSIDASCGSFVVTITDNTLAENGKDGAELYDDIVTEKDENGAWLLTVTGKSLDFPEGHDIEVKMEGHKTSSKNSEVVGTVTAHYVGAGTAYKYSTATLRSISREDGYEIADANDNIIIMSFTDAVEVDAAASRASNASTSLPFESVEQIDEEGKDWKVVIPRSILQGATGEVGIQLYAKDANGLVVKGDSGFEETSHITRSYVCYLGAPSPTIAPVDKDVETLEEFTFSYAEGIEVANPSAVIMLKGESGIVAQTTAEELTVDSKNSGTLTWKLAEGIIATGDYTLTVPSATFRLGGSLNKKTEKEYTVVDANYADYVSLSPSPESKPQTISTIQVTFLTTDWAFPISTQKISVLNENGDTIATATPGYSTSRTANNVCLIMLDKDITAAGTYIIDVPKGAFVFDVIDRIYNKRMRFTYTIDGLPDPAEKIESAPKEYKALAELSDIILTFSNASYTDVANRDSVAKLFNASDGELVTTGEIKTVSGRQRILIELKDKVTTDGTYTLHVPANSLLLNSKLYDKDLTFTYIVDVAAGVASIVATGDEPVRVYSLTGVLVREGKASEVLSGLKGAYIVNGKKMLLK